jgi:hypothetical protein
MSTTKVRAWGTRPGGQDSVRALRDGSPINESALTHHQNERQLSVTTLSRASFQHQEVALDAHDAYLSNRRSTACIHRLQTRHALHLVCP